jgi:subtilase family serine protease
VSRTRTRIFVALVIAAALAPLAFGATAGADPGGTPNPNADFGQSHRPVCPPAPSDSAHCDSEVVTKADGATPAATTTYANGYAPVDLQDAYKLPSATAGAGQTIAIVDAYDNPNAYNDLSAYRTRFGLPACPASTCFRKVNQNGQASPLPAGDVGWGQEIALDLDMASAVCPNCNILLVEANSNSFADLGAAVDRAATMGANAISNSYGGNEFSVEGSSSYNGHYNHPGHALTVSSGDSGYGAEFPAASQYVTAVGGTSLTRNTSISRGWSETAWSGAGSGCSSYIAKPTWQHDSGCSRRSVADVSAVANPSTGVAVYDSYGSSGGANWLVFGGTSVAAPVIAGVYALAGNASSVNYGSSPYGAGAAASLFDVTSGSNGHCRRTPYLCTAGAGYDGPTGLGTPNGTGAF